MSQCLPRHPSCAHCSEFPGFLATPALLLYAEQLSSVNTGSMPPPHFLHLLDPFNRNWVGKELGYSCVLPMPLTRKSFPSGSAFPSMKVLSLTQLISFLCSSLPTCPSERCPFIHAFVVGRKVSSTLGSYMGTQKLCGADSLGLIPGKRLVNEAREHVLLMRC